MKILAVDDDLVFHALLVPMLHSLGQKNVTTASSAADALVLLNNAAQDFDCILLDIQMPVMDGVELCRIIRDLPGYQRTPIVMITAMGTKKYIDDAFSAGATDYVTKPLERMDMKARIGMVERLLSERHLAQALALQVEQRSDVVTVDVDFEKAFMIPWVDRAIEYLGLENYLLTLSNNKMHSMSAMGIHVQNAASIFRKSSPAGFVDMLGDVATVINDSLKTYQLQIAYAGSGNFVCVFGNDIVLDPEDLELTINLGLADFDSVYDDDRLPLPQVKVGPAVRSSLFTSFKPTKILDRAITLAQLEQAPQPRAWWKVA